MKSLFSVSLIPVLFLGLILLYQPEAKDVEDDITWYTLEEAQELAAENGKKVMIYIMAEWCGYCKKMEQEVHPREKVKKALKTYYYPVILNIESDNVIKFNEESMTEQQFARKYRISGTPTYFFIDDKGEILGAQPGYIPADIFNRLLTYIGTDAYAEIKFDEYLENGKDETGEE